MFRPKEIMFVILVVALTIIAPFVSAQEIKQSPTGSGQVDDSTRRAEREAMYERYRNFGSYVKGGSVQAHWMSDGSRFWYAEGTPDNTVIYKVDPKANTKVPLFDIARLRKALAALLGHQPSQQGLPFQEFAFLNGEKAVKFTADNKDFIIQLDTYAITSVPVPSEEEKDRLTPRLARKSQVWWGGNLMEALSPDRRWFATLKEHNLWLRSATDARSVQITTGGIEDDEWGGHDFVANVGDGAWAWWSPDGSNLAVKKVDYRKVHKQPVVVWPSEEVRWRYFGGLAGDPIPRPELFIINTLSKQQVRVDTGGEPEQYIYVLGWRPGGSELFFMRMNRYYKRLDLMAADATTGATRVILTETSKTFLLAWEPFEWERRFMWLDDGKRFIWLSERDGWDHLYLYDLQGKLIRRLTEGEFPVMQALAVDDKGGWVYFTANGDRQRPYDTHLYRVTLDGRGFTQLTQAAGRHSIQFAPSKQFFLDSHSSVSRPPVVELRRADGTEVQSIAKANIDALKELKWSPPEEFVVKAADGKTDLHGVLYKPYDFDPNKKYPVVEAIYAGPQLVRHQRTFIPSGDTHLTHLGFIVFTVDGRGTPERGKAFQDVVYGNFGRYEIPDHVAALKQLAAKRPYMDLSRVGIMGNSYGGYFTIRAMLLAPEVYHVGIPSMFAGDLYHHQEIIEPYMGPPQDNREGYEYGSNERLAKNLRGKLLLVQGTKDILFDSTLQFLDVLAELDKPYDLVIVPGLGHGVAYSSAIAKWNYWGRVQVRYLQEHLKP